MIFNKNPSYHHMEWMIYKLRVISGYVIPCAMWHKVIEKFIGHIQEIKLPTNTMEVMSVFT